MTDYFTLAKKIMGYYDEEKTCVVCNKVLSEDEVEHCKDMCFEDYAQEIYDINETSRHPDNI